MVAGLQAEVDECLEQYDAVNRELSQIKSQLEPKEKKLKVTSLDVIGLQFQNVFSLKTVPNINLAFFEFS